MKSDKYIIDGESQYDVRFCLKCRKPTLQQLVDGKWKCVEHIKKSNRRRRKNDGKD